MRHNGNTIQWNSDELKEISDADDLKISPFREDGITYGTPTWIWNVVVDGELYARAYHGQKSRWYQAALNKKSGRIHAAGMVRDVLFEKVEGLINERIDKAYQVKYKGSPYLNSMISGNSKSATVRIIQLNK